ncbi:LysM peptidoglycan-binding domain-containing protein [Candidatus Villigracilis affinis]|uniref:LysM peptidoglycan-binding domain-containing protein n=1 Tax=Candidatus Villigracilis affinis TaxID=3140682 RepID=UPI001DD1B3F5|nr:LysM peptidoglycan-binding domain-containing protein [Anaerolineales bacterium]
MYRPLAILIILSLILSACISSSPSIWGVPQTPTPNTLDQFSLPIDPFAVQDNPIIFPTSTIPPSIATENAYTPTLTITPNSSTPVIEPTYTLAYDAAPFLYYAQSGDMLSAVASRFGVDESEITSDADLTKTTLIDPGTLLVIPNRITEAMTPNIQIMPMPRSSSRTQQLTLT